MNTFTAIPTVCFNHSLIAAMIVRVCSLSLWGKSLAELVLCWHTSQTPDRLSAGLCKATPTVWAGCVHLMDIFIKCSSTDFFQLF